MCRHASNVPTRRVFFSLCVNELITRCLQKQNGRGVGRKKGRPSLFRGVSTAAKTVKIPSCMNPQDFKSLPRMLYLTNF
jgi:hypothetical protein